MLSQFCLARYQPDISVSSYQQICMTVSPTELLGCREEHHAEADFLAVLPARHLCQ